MKKWLLSGFYIFFVLGSFIPEITYAQEKEDVIYLKNGSILRGKLLSKDSTQIKIETIGRNVWVFEQAEVEKITSENVFNEKSSWSVSKKGYFNSVDMGLNIGKNQASYSLSMINGYSLDCGLRMGVYTGVEGVGETIFPLMASVEYSPLRKRFSPFVILQGGYSFPANYRGGEYDYYYSYSKYKGGLALRGGLGLHTMLGENFAFSISGGYFYQVLTQEYSYYSGKTIYIYEYNRIFLKLGLFFK